MSTRRQLNEFVKRATGRGRLWALVVFLAVAGGFVLLWLAGEGIIDPEWLFNPCGFKQRFGLPCPTCGMTTAAIAFVRGNIIESFVTQPAGAFLCTLAFAAAFLALLTAAFGIYFSFLERLLREIRIRDVVLAGAVIVAAGWAFTLTRAIAQLRGIGQSSGW